MQVIYVFNQHLSQERTKVEGYFTQAVIWGTGRGGGGGVLGGKSRASGTRTDTQRRGKEESLSPRGFATRSRVLSRLASLASQNEALACGL